MKNAIVFLICSSFVFAANAFGAEGSLGGGRVITTLVADEGRWGGCMARLDRNIVDAGVDCPGSWVTFSCSGEFTTVSNARTMFDQALLASALNRRTFVVVDDSRKHNGFCYANRIDIVN